MNSIPSDQDFARADKRMEQRYHGVGAVEANVARHFKNKCPFVLFEIVPYGDSSFSIFTFFKTDKDVEVYKQAGICQEIVDFVYAEFERAGRGSRQEIKASFEFDSEENVIANWNGSYQIRARAKTT